MYAIATDYAEYNSMRQIILPNGTISNDALTEFKYTKLLDIHIEISKKEKEISCFYPCSENKQKYNFQNYYEINI